MLTVLALSSGFVLAVFRENPDGHGHLANDSLMGRATGYGRLTEQLLTSRYNITS